MDLGEGIIIAAGDLNYISDLKLDRTYKHGNMSILKEKLHTLFNTYNLTDTWRHTYSTAKDYKFYSPRHSTHSHKDRLYPDIEE